MLSESQDILESRKLKPDFALPPDLTQSPADYADTTFHAYAERMSDNYTYILKKSVVPGLPGLGDLKLRELRILASLNFFSKPLSPIQISEILSYDPATVTRASVKLVSAGKVKRVDNDFDTRSVLLHLTKPGRALANIYQKRLRHVFTALEQELDNQLSHTDKIKRLNMMVELNKRASDMRALCTKHDWDFSE